MHVKCSGDSIEKERIFKIFLNLVHLVIYVTNIINMKLKAGLNVLFLRSKEGRDSNYTTREVFIRNPIYQKRTIISEKKNISCIKITKQLNRIDFDLT